MRTELEWEFRGVWPLDNGDYYLFQWRTYCGQYLITGSFYEDGWPSFDVYSRGISSWVRLSANWTALKRAKYWCERYAKGKVKVGVR